MTILAAGMAPRGGEEGYPHNVCSQIGHSWSKSSIFPQIGHTGQKNMFRLTTFEKLLSFVRYGHILSHLAIFCLSKSYFALIICYLR